MCRTSTEYLTVYSCLDIVMSAPVVGDWSELFRFYLPEGEAGHDC